MTHNCIYIATVRRNDGLRGNAYFNHEVYFHLPAISVPLRTESTLKWLLQQNKTGKKRDRSKKERTAAARLHVRNVAGKQRALWGILERGVKRRAPPQSVHIACSVRAVAAGSAVLAGSRCRSDTFVKGWTGLIASNGAPMCELLIVFMTEKEGESWCVRASVLECVRKRVRERWRVRKGEREMCVSFSPLSVPLGLNLLLSRSVLQFPHGHHPAKPQWRSSQQKAMCGLKVRILHYFSF